MEKKKTVLQLNSILPEPVRLNKPLVMGIAAVFLFGIIFSIISAFDGKNASNSEEKIEIRDQSTEKLDNLMLQELPDNYQDAEALQRFSAISDKNEMQQEILQRLELLQEENEALRQKIELMSSISPSEISVPQTDSEAKKSTLLFNNINSASNVNTSVAETTSPNNFGKNNSSFLQPDKNVITDEELKILKLSSEEQRKYFDKKNSDEQKLSVLEAQDNPEDIYDLHRLTTPVSPYEIQAGTTISATLISGVNTSVAGTVVAQSRFDVYDTVSGKFLLVPKGSKIIGEYDTKISYGQRRVLIAFNRIIRPDGTSILLGKPTAADLQGQAGMEGEVNNHWGRVLGAATLSTILSVGAGVASDNVGNNTYYPSAAQNAILGVSNSASQVGQNVINRELNVQPTITIPAGFQFNIIVRRDMVLMPYQPQSNNGEGNEN
jgi:type IV secretory pathway VirB10-like protein